MGTEIKNAVSVADHKAEYDERAKRLLGQKIILAHILVKTVAEFNGMNPKDVVDYIEGEPMIGVVPVEPGLTNMEKSVPAELGLKDVERLTPAKGTSHPGKERAGDRVVGFNTENAEINEGLVRFDIVFYVRMRDGLSQIIVNVEAQKNASEAYSILNRAIFYVCRLVSSQKERDFVHMNYDDIKRVYSIWICMNMPENSMEHIQLARKRLLGDHEWAGKLDALNIVMIGLSRTLPERDEKYELHRLLAALLSKEMKPVEKLSLLEREYDIPVKAADRKEIFRMCNLSEGIVEETTAKVTRDFILNMYKKNCDIEMIAEVANKSIFEVEEIICGEKTALSK